MKKFFLHVCFAVFVFISPWVIAITQAGADSLEMISIAPDEASSEPGPFTVSGDYLFFTAKEASESPYRLFRTDGTATTTIPLTTSLMTVQKGSPMIDFKESLFFSAAIPYTVRQELCKSDGTPTGTVLVKDINTEPDTPSMFTKSSSPGYFAVFNDFLYFTATNTSGERELFQSNATEQGTVQVTELYGYSPTEQKPNIAGLNFFILFNSNSHYGEQNGELYQYVPGLGYAMVKNIRPGPEPSSPSNLITMDGWTYFNADDGAHGRELWKTNGTEAGTQMIKDITPGTEGNSFGEAIIYNNLLFFTVKENDELWRSDGTEGTPPYKDGTYCIAKTAPWYASSEIKDLTIHDGYLYFSAFDGGGRELWRTDGTASGTQRLTYNFELSYGTNPENITSCNGRLFLTGHYDSWKGREILEYKTCEETLVLIEDINKDSLTGSDPEDFTCFKNKLFFSADDGISGKELWVLSMPAQATALPGLLMLLLD